MTEGHSARFPGAKVDPQRAELTSAAAGASCASRHDEPPTPTRRAGRTGPRGGPRMISRFFIERPVLANVIALVFVLIGLVALFQLPNAQYPNVVPPTVQVTTRYPGASAKTLSTPSPCRSSRTSTASRT